jgi:hypothetical protein
MPAGRLPVLKLAASAVAPLNTPAMNSALFQWGATWPQDVSYLRDTYNEIQTIWERLKEPNQDQELYTETEPRLRELIVGLGDVAKELTTRTDIYQSVNNAEHDFNTSTSYAAAQDYATATIYQSYALMKIHNMLDTLTSFANKRLRQASFEKLGYGYDISGEQSNYGGTSGQDNNVRDLANPQNGWETSKNKTNFYSVDGEAEQDFPELAEFKHKRIHWPARTR